MGFLSWLFGAEKSSSGRIEDGSRYKGHPIETWDEDAAIRDASRPDGELVRIMNRQLEPCPEPLPADRAGQDRLQAASNGVRGLLDEHLERRRQEREVAARKRAEACPDVRFSIRAIPPSYAEIKQRVEQNKSLGRLLVKYVNERCEGHASWCYQRAGVSRQLYSQIISNPAKHVFKRTVMQLALGLKLSKDEADAFLAAAGYAFSPSSYEDQVFASCLSSGVYSLFDVNELLVRGLCTPIAAN